MFKEHMQNIHAGVHAIAKTHETAAKFFCSNKY